MTARDKNLVLAALAVLGAVAYGAGVFLAVDAAPCDPSAAVLSDGTRAAPGAWPVAWVALMVASSACVGVAVALVSQGRWPRRSVRAGIGASIATLVCLWVAGSSYWASQCPA